MITTEKWYHVITLDRKKFSHLMRVEEQSQPRVPTTVEELVTEHEKDTGADGSTISTPNNDNDSH